MCSSLISSNITGCVDWNDQFSRELNAFQKRPLIRCIRFCFEKVGSIAFRIKRITWDQSVFADAAWNEKTISKEKRKHKRLSTFQQFKLGLQKGAIRLPYKLAIATGFYLTSRDIYSSHVKGVSTTEEIGWAHVVIVNFIICYIEELIFRGFLQPTISASQKTVRCVVSKQFQDNRVFKEIISLRTRIFMAHVLFAACHVDYPCFNDIFDSQCKQAMQKTINVLCSLPIQIILRETTGDITAPFAAHFINNMGSDLYASLLLNKH